MKAKWIYLPLALALAGCNENGDENNGEKDLPVSSGYSFDVSGSVYGEQSSPHQIKIYAGEQLLSSGNSDFSGGYKLSINISNQIFDALRKEPLLLTAEDGEIELKQYLDTTLQQAVASQALSQHLSPVSTAQYILADSNDDGLVTADEWKGLINSSQPESVNKSLLQYATALQSVIEGNADHSSLGSVAWLSSLKSSHVWNQWVENNELALNTAWEANFSEPLVTESRAYLDLSNTSLDDLYYQQSEIINDKVNRCSMTLSWDGSVDPTQGYVDDILQLNADIIDRTTGMPMDGVLFWSTNNPAVASIDQFGKVELLSVGLSTVSAVFNINNDICQSNVDINVLEDNETIELTNARIVDFPSSLELGESVRLKAEGDWSNGTTTDISAQANWSVQPEDAATIEGGVLTAKKVGGPWEVNIFYKDKGMAEHFTIVDELVILPAVTELELAGYTGPKYERESWQLTATALMDDDSTRDVTHDAQWLSLNTQVATVQAGQVIALAKGSSVVKATYEGKSQSVTVVVEEKDELPPAIISIRIDGDTSSKPIGETWQLMAMGAFDNDTSRNLTDIAMWSTSDSNVASVIKGKVTAKQSGTVKITAAHDSKSMSVILVVEEDAVIDSLDVKGYDGSKKSGQSWALQALATLSDESTLDVSSKAQWSSSDETVASVLNGVVLARAEGTATISVQYQEVNETITVVVEKDEDEVVLQSITINGGEQDLIKGQNITLTATAEYSDETSEDISRSAAWTSSAPEIASVVDGVVSAHNVGEVTLTVQFEGKQSSLKLTVESDEPVVVSLEIEGDVKHFRKGDTRQLKAMAVFDDGEKRDITMEAQWSSNNTDALTVTAGMIEGISQGNALVKVQWEEFPSSSVAVLVEFPDLVEIVPNIFNNELEMLEGEEHTQGLKLFFSDETSLDYSGAIKFSMSGERDESGLRIADITEGGFRAYRAGLAKLTIRDIGTELAEILRRAKIEVSGSYAYVDLEVKANPDTYIWRRTNYGLEDHFSEITQVFDNEVVYQFWEKRIGSVYHGVYVTAYDGEKVTEPYQIFEGRGLNPSLMINGGGNGYVVLQNKTSNGYLESFIFNLETKELAKIDFTNAPIEQLVMGSRNNAYSVTKDGNLILVWKSSSSKPYMSYLYDVKEKKWTEVETMTLPDSRFVQTLNGSEYLTILDYKDNSSSSAGFVSPSLHFIDGNTGKKAKSVQFRKPVNANADYCVNIYSSSVSSNFQIAVGESINNISAYCYARSGYPYKYEFWLWDDITNYPTVFSVEEWESIHSDGQLAIGESNGLTFAAGGRFRDASGADWYEIREYNVAENKAETVHLPFVSNKYQVNQYNSTIENIDTSNLMLENNYVEAEVLMLFNGKFAIRSQETGKWYFDDAMFGLPGYVNVSNRIYKIGNTWHYFGGSSHYSNDNYFWKLQLRNPEAEVLH